LGGDRDCGRLGLRHRPHGLLVTAARRRLFAGMLAKIAMLPLPAG
jgi:hypothetical protein